MIPVKLKYRYEYVWIDSSMNLRSKSRTLKKICQKIDDVPFWKFDGSSTGQATSSNSDVYLKPVKLYIDPFSKRNLDSNNNSLDYLVMCELYNSDLTKPHNDNKRYRLEKLIKNSKKIQNAKTLFGFELEFFLYDNKTNLPLGFKNKNDVPKQGKFYCSVGASNNYGRELINDFYDKALKSGVNIVGLNAEVACGQWEYQVLGDPLDSTDDAWMSRYIISRVGEKYDININWHPKPIKGDCNGSGMHVNFSTKRMREDVNGIKHIYSAINKLEMNHSNHMELYGKNNFERLTGNHETSDINKFSWDYSNRNCSIRVGEMTKSKKRGYFEDRRPASSSNMYDVAYILIKTILT